MQANDPALAGDTQLTTMRAAADYMMGRYRDAHNDLAGAGLRFRPPCRLVARPDRSGAGKLEGRARPSGAGRAGDEALFRRLAGRAPCWPMPMRRWAWAGWIWPMRR